MKKNSSFKNKSVDLRFQKIIGHRKKSKDKKNTVLFTEESNLESNNNIESQISKNTSKHKNYFSSMMNPLKNFLSIRNSRKSQGNILIEYHGINSSSNHVQTDNNKEEFMKKRIKSLWSLVRKKVFLSIKMKSR